LVCVLCALSGVAFGFHAPEIDPGSMAGGITLLVGGMMMFVDRHRKKGA
jgi:hypothetical protein